MRLVDFQEISPYDFIFKSEFIAINGQLVNKRCQKCINKFCANIDSFSKEGTYKCERNFWNFVIHTNNQNSYILNGLLFDHEADQHQRQYFSKCIVSIKEIDQFIDYIKGVDEIIEKRIINTIEENFSVFHDIKTTATTVTNCAEKLINKCHGDDFETKLSNSDKSLIDLYDSISLLRDHLNMIDILVNSNKIKYAKKIKINIFQLFERISRLLRNNAEKKKLQINWSDNGRISDCYLYPSFQFIPLVLLDNAIKYSFEKKSIEVIIYDNTDGYKVEVSSYGNFVPQDEEAKIFDKYYKGRNANNKEGIGMGLWIADQICEAHNGKIYYEKNGNGNYGQNVFNIEIPKMFN